MMETGIFSADIQELHKVLNWLRIRLEQKKMENKMIRSLELVLEEAVVNIIQHGYAGKKGKIKIGLKWSQSHLEITIRDWGPPFDPLTSGMKIDSALSREKEIGGFGIFLMKQILDEILYQRENDANVLTLIKHFSRTK